MTAKKKLPPKFEDLKLFFRPSDPSDPSDWHRHRAAERWLLSRFQRVPPEALLTVTQGSPSGMKVGIDTPNHAAILRVSVALWDVINTHTPARIAWHALGLGPSNSGLIPPEHAGTLLDALWRLHRADLCKVPNLSSLHNELHEAYSPILDKTTTLWVSFGLPEQTRLDMLHAMDGPLAHKCGIYLFPDGRLVVTCPEDRVQDVFYTLLMQADSTITHKEDKQCLRQTTPPTEPTQPSLLPESP